MVRSRGGERILEPTKNADRTLSSTTAPHPASCCPLCGGLNGCGSGQTDSLAGCWCTGMSLPAELLARVPPNQRNQVCICRNCILAFHHEQAAVRPNLEVLPGDFYFEGGFLVFTAAYLRRRGYCCRNNCRHCPYRSSVVQPASAGGATIVDQATSRSG
ncbi:MAG: cysteine-rich CWC family protein [Verrucomicrobia bacterium]|nr:cysteine-rich CWC family protein [Verrucomicrobiota bacterium]